MSPARSRRRPIPHRRSRSDIVKAVAVAAGIVVGTSLIIWLMRPGPEGVQIGTGGLMNRQPRTSWLIGVALGVGGVATWYILRVNRKAHARAKVVLPITLGGVVVAAIIGAIVWPGGVLRHDQAPPPITTPSTTQPPVTTTTVSSSTTVASGGTTTTGSTATTTSTATSTTTPTTGGSTTTSP